MPDRVLEPSFLSAVEAAVAAEAGRPIAGSTAAGSAWKDGAVTCPRAHLLARRLGVSPAVVGAAADDLGVRVSRCQLGLFGYGSKAEGKHKIVRAMDPVPPALASRLRSAAAGSGGLTCAQVWEIARQARIGRLDAAGAVQGLGLQVTVCQLGCFKPRPPARL